MNSRTLAKQLLPPILVDAIRRGRDRVSRPPESGTLRPASWYDQVYRSSRAYREHYSDSHYYFIWAVVADRLAARPRGAILDLGAGPGQFAELIRDRGIVDYRGVDFSPESVRLARERCPQFGFVVADLEDRDHLDLGQYDVVLALEFLEHIADDLALLRHLRSDTVVFFTVPNFEAPAHVRFFADAQAVTARYSELFSDLNVSTLTANREGMKFFLASGTLK